MNPRARRAAVVLVTLPALLGLQTLVPAGAAGLPDLKVTSFTTSASSVEAGSPLGLTDTTKNVGRKSAPRSSTRLYLSADDAVSKDDVVLGKRAVPALASGETSTRSLDVLVPSGTQARSYYVIACADATHAVTEAKEGNNCHASAPVAVTSAGGPVTFPEEPDPLSVTPTLETGRATTTTAQAADVAGATTMSATAADGTTFTLQIPFRALTTPEDVTMTPVQGIAGLPFSDGFVAGVRLEPEGLLLQKPATLTIESPDAGALAEQTGFVFHDDGDDFHLYPMDLPQDGDDKDVVRMSLTHFSTPGVGLATNTDRAQVTDHPPARDAAQIEQRIATLISLARSATLKGQEPDPTTWDQVTELQNAYFDDILRPKLVSAEEHPDEAMAAMTQAISWARVRALLGDTENPRITEVFERVEKIAHNLVPSFEALCKDTHDLSAAVWLLGLARTAALLSWSWSDEAAAKALQCAHFELRLDTKITGTRTGGGGGISYTVTELWHLKSTTEVGPEGAGEGTLDYTEKSYLNHTDYPPTGDGCGAQFTDQKLTSTSPGKTSVVMILKSNPRILPPLQKPPLAIVIVRPGQGLTSIGTPMETYTTTGHLGCLDIPPSTAEDSGWFGAFAAAHGGKTSLRYEITEPAAWDLMMADSFDHDYALSDGQRHETTYLELFHTPQF